MLVPKVFSRVSGTATHTTAFYFFFTAVIGATRSAEPNGYYGCNGSIVLRPASKICDQMGLQITRCFPTELSSTNPVGPPPDDLIAPRLQCGTPYLGTHPSGIVPSASSPNASLLCSSEATSEVDGLGRLFSIMEGHMNGSMVDVFQHESNISTTTSKWAQY